MKKPTRKWTLDIIHHSHTDIGYTERQEKIERFHVHFIKQALQILSSIKSGEKSNWEGFKWTCETFWPVERFLAQATDDEAQAFQAYVRSGDISLSGTYLNMTELIDADLLARMNKRSTKYANSIGVTLDSAMTADINGYSWGFAQCLLDAGIHNRCPASIRIMACFRLDKSRRRFGGNPLLASGCLCGTATIITLAMIWG